MIGLEEVVAMTLSDARSELHIKGKPDSISQLAETAVTVGSWRSG